MSTEFGTQDVATLLDLLSKLRQQPDLSGVVCGLGEAAARVDAAVAGVGGGGMVAQSGTGVSAGDAVAGVDAASDAESEASAVSGGAPGVVGEGVRRAVCFGGLADCAVSSGGEVRQYGKKMTGGFYSSVVRGANTKALAAKLLQLSGSKVPKAAMGELAVCTFAAGTMPDVILDGKAKLNALANVGDAALSMHVAAHLYSAGRTVENIQRIRSSVLSDKALNAVMIESGLAEYVQLAPGVDSKSAKSLATAFEAMVGVLVLYRYQSVVNTFLQNVGVLM